MNELFLLLIVFVVGCLTKYVDLIEDNGIKSFKHANVLCGLVYSILILFVIINWPILSPLVLGTILGLILTKKIDAPGHILGIGLFVVLFVLYYWPLKYLFGGMFVYLFIIFTCVNIIDEIVNGLTDNGVFTRYEKLEAFLKTRPFLEMACFIVAFLLGEWLIWLAILFYDMGYMFTAKFVS